MIPYPSKCTIMGWVDDGKRGKKKKKRKYIHPSPPSFPLFSSLAFLWEIHVAQWLDLPFIPSEHPIPIDWWHFMASACWWPCWWCWQGGWMKQGLLLILPGSSLMPRSSSRAQTSCRYVSDLECNDSGSFHATRIMLEYLLACFATRAKQHNATTQRSSHNTTHN